MAAQLYPPAIACGSRGYSVSINKKRRFIAPCRRYLAPPAVETAARLAKDLCYVDAELLPILALNRLHLIFEAQFQLLQTDFFQLFIFAEVAFLGECIETLCV